ncbi:ATP-dependent_RNA helicase [Hexamita inflata]|uniref:ATP-dependent RNA helicase n=1 Tax=Hexamita inflata TaxID=28002 RepID=A0AA86UP09_9EUKA|nr:ATP-dependent RNA helicase [Hexamita inflata]
METEIQYEQVIPELADTTFLDNKLAMSLVKVDNDINTSQWIQSQIHPGLANYLIAQNMTTPTKIQKLALKNQDISQIIIAETGSGKSLSYLLPIVNQIFKDIKASGEEPYARALQAVVLTPTHELAIQLQKAFNLIFKEIQSTLYLAGTLVGGLSIQKQQRILAGKPLIIFATPGRAMELLTDDHLLTVKKLVIDEADRMLERGQFSDLVKFCQRANSKSNPKIILASATLNLPQQLGKTMKLTSKPEKMTLRYEHATWTEQEKNYLNVLQNLGFKDQSLQLINAAPEQVTNKSVHEIWHFVENETEKQQLLAYLVISFKLPTLVFCSTIQECKMFAECFQLIGLESYSLHSKQQQKARMKSIEKLQNTSAVIFTTDLAARGIDIPQVKLVIQYSKPNSPSTHVHRIGRCARAQSTDQKIGVAISLIAPEDCEDFKVIQKMCGMTTPNPLSSIRFDVQDRVAHVMNAAFQVYNVESEVKNIVNTFRRVKSKQLTIDESDESDHEEKDAYQVTAEMMNNLKNRKEMKLGKYFQMLHKNEVQPEDLVEMVEQMKFESLKFRKALRMEIQRGIERQCAKMTIDIGLFTEQLRQLKLPEQQNPLFITKKEPSGKDIKKEAQKQKELEKKEAKLKFEKKKEAKERAEAEKEAKVPKFQIIEVGEVVDPLIALARTSIEEEKKNENFKKIQNKVDAFKNKEEQQRKRQKAENAVSATKFMKLTRELAGEVDKDFMKMGPKEQRVKKLMKFQKGDKKDKE